MRNLCKNLNRYMSATKDQIEAALTKHYKKNELIDGFCKPEQTQKFSKIDPNIHPDHWRTPKYINQKIKLSSIGLGTQNGQLTSQGNSLMFQVLLQSVKSGKVNVIDTDVNFRYGRSQKVINALLNHLREDHKISRQSLFITTKCGYMLHDLESNLDQKKFINMLVSQGYLKNQDVLNECYSLHPNFIQFSVQKSMLSLGVKTIDLVYLNNPAQAYLPNISSQEYYEKLRIAFEHLEVLRATGKIRYYGIASFVSFRSPLKQEGIHASLHQTIQIAKKVGGQNHGLRFVLVPFNLGMPEILLKWQLNKNKTEENIFNVAQQSQVNVNLCTALYQGNVVNLPFKSQLLNHIKSNAAKHLNFVRSIPKQSLLTTFFGTNDIKHFQQDMQAIYHRCLTDEQWRKILSIPNPTK